MHVFDRVKPSQESLRAIEEDPYPKEYLVCPKEGKGNPIYFYVISPEDFEPVSIAEVFTKTKQIRYISKKALEARFSFFSRRTLQESDVSNETENTKRRIKTLDLADYEAQLIFYELFERCLIQYIQREDPTIEDGRKTETSALLREDSSPPRRQTSPAFSSFPEYDQKPCCCSISTIFKTIFCCCS